MEIILDTNQLLSIMNPLSTASYIFSLEGMNFFAPEYILSEFFKYENISIKKSGLSEQEFEMRFKEVS